MAVKVNIKSGARDVQIDSVTETPGDGGKWSESETADGHKIYTSVSDTASASVQWGPGDTQSHPDMKTGSTVETWRDSNGNLHATIRRKL